MILTLVCTTQETLALTQAFDAHKTVRLSISVDGAPVVVTTPLRIEQMDLDLLPKDERTVVTLELTMELFPKEKQ